MLYYGVMARNIKDFFFMVQDFLYVRTHSYICHTNHAIIIYHQWPTKPNLKL
jgi:hypothetical protein